MQIRLEAETLEPDLVTGQPDMRVDGEIVISDQGQLHHLGTERYMDGVTPTLIAFALSTASGVGTGVVAAALWDHLKQVLLRMRASRARDLGTSNPSARGERVRIRLSSSQTKLGGMVRAAQELDPDLTSDTDPAALDPLITGFLTNAEPVDAAGQASTEVP